MQYSEAVLKYNPHIENCRNFCVKLEKIEAAVHNANFAVRRENLRKVLTSLPNGISLELTRQTVIEQKNTMNHELISYFLFSKSIFFLDSCVVGC